MVVWLSEILEKTWNIVEKEVKEEFSDIWDKALLVNVQIRTIIKIAKFR